MPRCKGEIWRDPRCNYLDKLPVSDFWIALGFLTAGYVCWWWDRDDNHRQEKDAAQAAWQWAPYRRPRGSRHLDEPFLFPTRTGLFKKSYWRPSYAPRGGTIRSIRYKALSWRS